MVSPSESEVSVFGYEWLFIFAECEISKSTLYRSLEYSFSVFG